MEMANVAELLNKAEEATIEDEVDEEESRLESEVRLKVAATGQTDMEDSSSTSRRLKRSTLEEQTSYKRRNPKNLN